MRKIARDPNECAYTDEDDQRYLYRGKDSCYPAADRNRCGVQCGEDHYHHQRDDLDHRYFDKRSLDEYRFSETAATDKIVQPDRERHSRRSLGSRLRDEHLHPAEQETR